MLTVQRHSVVQLVLEHVQVIQSVRFSIQRRLQGEGISVLGNAEENVRLRERKVQCNCLRSMFLRVMV